MISRHIPMKSPNSGGPKRLIGYLCDDQGKASRIEHVFMSNLVSEDPAGAALEMQLTQQSNTTATGNKTYHLVISFAPGEEPSEAVLRAVEHEVAKSMGYQEHQRVAVVHHDTDCLHIQVAINKVHPDTLRCVTPKNDYRKRQEACARLEKQYGFVVGSGIKDGRDAGRDLAKGMEKFSGNQSLTNWVRATLKDSLLAAKSWEAFDQLCADSGLKAVRHGGGMVFTDGCAFVKASAVDKGLSLRRVEQRLGSRPLSPVERAVERAGPGQRPGASGGAKGAAEGARPTPSRRANADKVPSETVKAIVEAKNWQEVHEACRRAGIKIRVKGNGMAFVTPRGEIKASAIERGFSKAMLEKRLGAFKPDEAMAPRPAQDKSGRSESRRQYQKRPADADKNALYEKYCDWKEQASNGAKAERMEAKRLLRQRLAAAKDVYYSRKALAGKNRVERHVALSEYREKMAQCRIDYRATLANIGKRHRRLAWVDWLKKTAMGGGEDAERAIVALRARAKGMAWKTTAGMSGTAAPRTVYENGAKIDVVTRNGTVIYDLGDELVRDNGSNFYCSKGTSQDTLIAVLAMAKRRFGDELDITGDEAFKDKVVKAAVQGTVSGKIRGGVVFKDPKMERERRRLLNIHGAKIAEARKQHKSSAGQGGGRGR